MAKALEEPLIFERSREGRAGIGVPAPDVPIVDPHKVLPRLMVREEIAGFPELAEIDVARHFTKLSTLNFGVETGFYPLGSCTMKYNPKLNEEVAALPGFSGLHPYQPEETVQGALALTYELEELLQEISGMDAITLHPAAGAHGELTGMLMLSAYYRDKGETRHKVLIPDTAHGTNPSSCTLGGFTVVPVKTGPDGILTAEAVAELMDEDTAALMLTNPNTLGLFESNIKEISDIIHEKGGFVYCDGANLNAIMGLAKFGEMGVDIVQLNLHKTFSTPHGGGGPGSGPVGVTKELEPYLPNPRIIKTGDGYAYDTDRPKSIGRMRAFHSQFTILVRAYAYIRRLGSNGLKEASEAAILNANYLKEQLRDTYELPYDAACMHECVFSDKLQQERGITTMDIAKRLMDYGIHPPTIYFPLVVPGALMIEPTECEGLDTIDNFVDVMKKISAEDPELVKGAPHTAPRKRVDEIGAARRPRLRWITPEEDE